MSGADTLNQRVKRYLMSLPGKRGIDIPEAVFDRIAQAARGETLPVWGRHPTPEQFQHLYDNGIHEPAQIKEAYGNLDHPHVPGVKVKDYPQWAEAYGVFKRSRGKLNAS